MSQDFSQISASSGIADSFEFWGKTYSRHELKKKSLYAIFLIWSHTLNLFSYLDPSRQAEVFAYLTGGSLVKPTELEAFDLQVQLQRQMMIQNRVSAPEANRQAADLLAKGFEVQIEIGDIRMSLRDWITSFIEGNFPETLQIPINMVRHLFEITYKLEGQVWWGLKATEENLKKIAETNTGPILGLLDVIQQSTAADGALYFLSNLTIGQCFTISIIILGMKYVVIPNGSGVLNFIIGQDNARTLLSLPQTTRNKIFGAVDSLIDYLAVTILSDAALHSLVLPGPEGKPEEIEDWINWGEKSKEFLKATGKFSATGLARTGSSEDSSSTTNFDEDKAIINLIDRCVGAAVGAAAGGARAVVLGFRSFYRALTEGADSDSSSESASDSSVSTSEKQSKQTDISVYTFLSSVVSEESLSSFKEDLESYIGESRDLSEGMLEIGDTKSANFQDNQEIRVVAISGGGAYITAAILNKLIPSDCSRQPSQSNSQMSDISEDDMDIEQSNGCELSMVTIVIHTLENVINQIDAAEGLAKLAKLEEKGGRKRTRKYRKATKGRKTRKQYRIRKTHKYRRPRKSRKGRKSRKY